MSALGSSRALGSDISIDAVLRALADDPTSALSTIGAATPADISGKLNASLVSAWALTLVANTTAAGARTTLGLGSAALSAASAFQPTGSYVNSSVLSAFGTTLVGAADATAARSTLGLGTAATHPATDFQTAGAYLTANQTVTLSGDVSGSGATAITVTIGANKVTRGMLAAATGATLLGATGAGNIADLTAAQVKTFLGITESDVASLTTDLAAKAPFASPQFTGVAYYQQPSPTAKTATGTLTIADLLTLIITVTSTTAVTLTLPTGTLADAGILSGGLGTNEAFEWYIINLGSSAGATTIAQGTGHTIVGSAVVAISTSARFLTRKTAANTFVTYRIA